MAYGADIDYVQLQIDDVAETSLALVGETLIMAEALVETVVRDAGSPGHTILKQFKGSTLAGAVGAPFSRCRLIMML